MDIFTIRILEQTIVELADENGRLKKNNANHIETLKGIASMPDEDGQRMKLWARDELSGHVESLESTLLHLSDERNHLEAELATERGRIAKLERFVHRQQ